MILADLLFRTSFHFGKPIDLVRHYVGVSAKSDDQGDPLLPPGGFTQVHQQVRDSIAAVALVTAGVGADTGKNRLQCGVRVAELIEGGGGDGDDAR